MDFNYDLELHIETGDIQIVNQDIPLINNYKKYLLTYTNNILLSGYDSIFNDPSFGANLSSFIGTGINDQLLERIKLNITNALTAEGSISKSIFTVIATELKNTIYVRVIFTTESDTFSTNLQITKEGVELD